MQLKKIVEFNQFISSNDKNPWTIKDVSLKPGINLIVSMNAVGKTRLMNVINNFSQMFVNKTTLKEGTFDLEFSDGNEILKYRVSINSKRQVTEEKMSQGNKPLIDRGTTKSKIYSNKSRNMEDVNPPEDKLIVQVRRDKDEYPFLEKLFEWASNTYIFRASHLIPENLVVVPEDFTGDPLMKGFEFVPTIFNALSPKSRKELLADFNTLQFEVDDVSMQPSENIQLPMKAKFIHWFQKGLKKPIPQHEVSTGMLRSFYILLTLHYACEHDKPSKTMIIDDFLEGMDYKRAENISKIVQQKINKSNIQLILTSNSQVMMNGIDVKNWNILVKKDMTTVTSMNYENNRKEFDEFLGTGLSNFALFSSDFLKDA